MYVWSTPLSWHDCVNTKRAARDHHQRHWQYKCQLVIVLISKGVPASVVHTGGGVVCVDTSMHAGPVRKTDVRMHATILLPA